MTPKGSKFNDGERVLCYHGPLLYEAKCKRAELREKIVQYLIHYNGWNKSWDEWVTVERVLKYNQTNLAYQQELLQNQNKDKGKRSRPTKLMSKDKASTRRDTAATTLSSSPQAKPKRKRLRLDSDVTEDDEGDQAQIATVKIKLPNDLKVILRDDYYNVNRKGLLCKIVASKSVGEILTEYAEEMGGDLGEKSRLREFGKGIRAYFDHVLNTRCLYPQERKQYNDALMMNPGKTKSEIYGAIHLLRFFTVVGSLLGYSTLEKEHVGRVVDYIHKFLSFMDYKQADLFLREYV